LGRFIFSAPRPAPFLHGPKVSRTAGERRSGLPPAAGGGEDRPA